MNSWPWLIAAVAAGVGAYLTGWPTWAAHRARQARDLNAERYLAWRGRADRLPRNDTLTGAERQRLGIAIGLAVAGIACVVAFLAAG
jgi:hypothetical protein